MKIISLVSLMLLASFVKLDANDTGYTLISDETVQNPKDMFEGRCDLVRFVKISIGAKDVSGGIQILERLDQAASAEYKIDNNYYYSIIICYDVLSQDGKTRNILDKKIFFNLNDMGGLNSLPEGCPVPIPPLVPVEVKDDCKMGYQLGKIINRSIAY